jgi:hypothetical protein
MSVAGLNVPKDAPLICQDLKLELSGAWLGIWSRIWTHFPFPHPQFFLLLIWFSLISYSWFSSKSCSKSLHFFLVSRPWSRLVSFIWWRSRAMRSLNVIMTKGTESQWTWAPFWFKGTQLPWPNYLLWSSHFNILTTFWLIFITSSWHAYSHMWQLQNLIFRVLSYWPMPHSYWEQGSLHQFSLYLTVMSATLFQLSLHRCLLMLHALLFSCINEMDLAYHLLTHENQADFF